MGWTDSDRLTSYLLTQHDWDGTQIGILKGFITGSVTKEYYSDMRSIATIETVDDNYIDNALIKITAMTNKGDSASLGVFCVASVSQEQMNNDTIKRSYELKSVIYKAQTWLFGNNCVWTGTKTFGQILDSVSSWRNYFKFQASSVVRATTHTFSAEGSIYEIGTSVYSMLSDLADQFGLRMDVEDECIKFEKYVKPKDKPSTFQFAYDNATITSNIAIKNTIHETVNDCIVKCSNNNVTIIGEAIAGSGTITDPDVRKQIISKVYDVNDMNPQTHARANEIAAQNLKLQNPNSEISHNGLYVGRNAGDVGNVMCYSLNGNLKKHTVLIKSMGISLTADMNVAYTHKEVDANE